MDSTPLETAQVDVQDFESLRIMTPQSTAVENGETGEI